MKLHIGKLLIVPLALSPLLSNAQAITTLSSGGDARSCSLSAEMSLRLRTSRSDLDACDRALELMNLSRKDRAATFVNRGILNTAIGRYQEALNDYNEALEIDPELPQAFNGKGNLYYFADRYDDAIDAYERALALQLPQPQVAHYNLGLVYEKLGDPEAALRSYNAAVEAAPDWALARERLDRLQQR
jgi:tetratricopeptide (TPR) repeat protein